ncbi:MAG: NUDIX domain-containing protein [Porticoccaceae bacterium]|nr:NUDIX domain-containing protein [Pseudomonadales bacterium]MCP5173422.1 NUDIX domain-containing protein [Pseudomonadales bacterium]MCP5303235.1 NUDIX domain-containing protein [Pseudomonadales bacterium]
MSSIPEPRPAATVVLIRDGKQGLETLMLKRNKALLFAGGIWVFPGGALEQADWDGADGDESVAARLAAAREAEEESGLEIDTQGLVEISLWITPEAEPRRFHTWFFLTLAPDEPEVKIDGSEIHDHAWLSIDEAIKAHELGELGLFPPTIMTLRALQGYQSAEQAMAAMSERTPYEVMPVFADGGEDVQVFYPGDVSYHSADPSLQGAQHRSILKDGTWHYVHDGVVEDVTRLDS